MTLNTTDSVHNSYEQVVHNSNKVHPTNVKAQYP